MVIQKIRFRQSMGLTEFFEITGNKEISLSLTKSSKNFPRILEIKNIVDFNNSAPEFTEVTGNHGNLHRHISTLEIIKMQFQPTNNCIEFPEIIKNKKYRLGLIMKVML